MDESLHQRGGEIVSSELAGVWCLRRLRLRVWWMYASYAVTSSPFGASEDCARRRSARCGPYHLFALTMCFPRALSATSHLASTTAQPLGIFLGPTITFAMAFTYPHSRIRNFSLTLTLTTPLPPGPNPHRSSSSIRLSGNHPNSILFCPVSHPPPLFLNAHTGGESGGRTFLVLISP